jgi:hypothetical protein
MHLETLYTLQRPQPSTLDPQPSILNPQLATLNPQLSTLNPKICCTRREMAEMRQEMRALAQDVRTILSVICVRGTQHRPETCARDWVEMPKREPERVRMSLASCASPRIEGKEEERDRMMRLGDGGPLGTYRHRHHQR